MSFQEDKLTEIADAIRAKEGSTEPIIANTFAARIDALSTAGSGTSGVRSFNGRTGAVVPGIYDYTAEMVGALSEDGGTIYGNLRIKPGGSYGGILNFGDGEYVQISEPVDDCLEVKAKKINFVVSDATDQKFTLNGQPIGTGGEVDTSGLVPVTRTVNSKPLETDIVITTSDIPDFSSVLMTQKTELSQYIDEGDAQTHLELTQYVDQKVAEGGGDAANLLNRSTAVNVADTNYGVTMARGIYMGTEDLEQGVSELTSGTIYLVYE